ncbi:LPS-assembly protein LptD [Actibacterium sp. 188UL27-1]|uniref:LPS-assembly protein LptD n=1 Tax=Actibacterium sp. 188UL27-1 TaxID=2786961 RepID=UPI00195E4E93|nr:LPS assembly protein LptD [Actibacterium sp. 188UL27-1]MBM7067486.1 LPS-assembly protein LptD [Actibacterium sp. 188UL27-1]
MRRLIWVLALIWAASGATAQDLATLVADRLEIAQDSRLIASGNVEVLYQGDRVKAQTITYDSENESLQIDGPLTITSADGNTVFFASSAELSQDLRNGILTSARLVLDQQLQLAATEINRVDGRYTQLYKTVASSCHVCEAHPTPLWQIRARRIIHDEEERQIYFENARFEVVGIPVLYLPRLRFPDPSLDRATGFLAPAIRTTDELGFGIKTPYFIRLGDHADLTLTPYLSTSRTTTLEARYRQAFRTGEIELNMAVSNDDIRPDDTRAYLFGEGRFDLPRDYKLSFDIETVSDRSYLLDYDYSGKDRLDSAINLARTKRDSFFEADLLVLRSLRNNEDNKTSPTVIGDLESRRRFKPAYIGGTGSFAIKAHTHYRPSDLDVDGPDDDTFVDGRDVTRLTLQTDWRSDWLTTNGMIWAAMTDLRYDYTTISDDADFEDPVGHFTGTGAVELRWPLVRYTGGASHVIEPIMQLVYSSDTSPDVPNEESTLLELDEGNLFSFNRFPGGDRFERGIRANVGLSYTRYDPTGWQLGVTVGRILRDMDLGQFDGYPALDGQTSDWLAAAHVKLPGSLTLVNRAVFDDNFEFDRNELRMDYDQQIWSVGSSFIWLRENLAENRADVTSELTLDGDYRINDYWKTDLDVRYDFEQDRAASARFGLAYQNECVTVGLSLSRRFTSSDSVRPTTNFDMTVALAGFGKGDGDRPKRRRACRG